MKLCIKTISGKQNNTVDITLSIYSLLYIYILKLDLKLRCALKGQKDYSGFT